MFPSNFISLEDASFTKAALSIPVSKAVELSNKNIFPE